MIPRISPAGLFKTLLSFESWRFFNLHCQSRFLTIRFPYFFINRVRPPPTPLLTVKSIYLHYRNLVRAVLNTVPVTLPFVCTKPRRSFTVPPTIAQYEEPFHGSFPLRGFRPSCCLLACGRSRRCQRGGKQRRQG